MALSSSKLSPRPWAFLLLVVGSCIVGIAVCEIALRMAGFSAMVFEMPDLVRGTSLRPLAASWQSKEGHAYVSINSRGYRGKERSPSKPLGSYRIAVLGDSFVEARQVALKDTFCALLERLLGSDRRFAGRPIEVINFGVAGYGTAQEWLTLTRDVFTFQPDHIILAVFTGNDISDNSSELSHPLDTRPYYTLRGDDLIPDLSFLESSAFLDRLGWKGRLFYSMQEHSRLVQLLYNARRGFGQGPATAPDKPESPFNQRGLPHAMYREPFNAAWENAWRVTERLIVEMRKASVDRGMAFSVVTLSNPPQVFPDVAKRLEYEKELGVPDLFYPDRRIKALGERAGFPVLNLATSFQAYATEHQVLLHGFANTPPGMGHWNERAHRLAAERIAAWLPVCDADQSRHSDAPHLGTELASDERCR